MSKTFKDVFGLEIEDFCLKELKLLMTDYDWSSKIATQLDTDNMWCHQLPEVEALFMSWRDFVKDGVNPTTSEVLDNALMLFDENDIVNRELTVVMFERLVETVVTDDEVSAFKSFIMYENLYIRLLKYWNAVGDWVFSNFKFGDPEAYKEMINFGEALERMSTSYYRQIDKTITMMKLSNFLDGQKVSDYE